MTHEPESHGATGADAPERPTSFYQVLILLAAYLFSGGGDVALGERVREAIDDEARAEAAGRVADEIVSEHQRHSEQLVELRAAFFDVGRRYDASTTELEAALERGVAEAERFQSALLNARFRLVREMTADEWKAVCDDMESPHGL